MIHIELRELKNEDFFFKTRKPRGYYPIVRRPLDTIFIIILSAGTLSVIIHALVVYFSTINPLERRDTLYECGFITGDQPNRNWKVYEFRQVPFALRPTLQDQRVRDPTIFAELNISRSHSYRWHNPIPTLSLEACYLATRGVCIFKKASFHCRPRDFSPGCLITTSDSKTKEDSNETKGKTRENCLYLDISTPSLHREKVPVVVIVHGAGFLFPGPIKFETPEPFFPTPEEVFAHKMVFVRIQYRLGIFGTFFSVDNRRPDDIGKVRNFALRDILTGLRWVQRNIHRFGGDPGSVTFLGQGTGATLGLALLTRQKKTKEKLFHRIWLASGSSLLPKYDDKFFTAIRQDYFSILSKECVRKTAKCKGWEKMSDLEKLSRIDAPFLIKHIGDLTQSVHFSHNKVFGGLNDWNMFPESLPIWVGSEEGDTNFSVDPSLVKNSLDDIPTVMTTVMGEFDGYPGFKKWFTMPRDYIMEALATTELYSLLKNDTIVKRKEDRIKRLIVPLEDKMRLAAKRQIIGVTTTALLSVIRVMCPQYLLANLQEQKHRQHPMHIGLYIHRQAHPSKALLFSDSLKSTTFHGMDILLLLGTYTNYNMMDKHDSLFAKSIRENFRAFVHDGLKWPQVWNDHVATLWRDKVDSDQFPTSICKQFHTESILKMARRN